LNAKIRCQPEDSGEPNEVRHSPDTNICIYIAKAKPANVLQRFQAMDIGDVAMPLITTRRIAVCAGKSTSPHKTNHHEKRSKNNPLANTEVSEHYAHTRATLEKQQIMGK